MKSVITLLLALVFQLVQVLPAASFAEPCTSVGASCECCAPLASCPCAANDETPQKPSPLSSDAGSSLKVPVAKSTGTHVSVETVPGTQTVATVVASPITGPSPGYTGVRLSVAFCSFVI